MAVQNLKTQGSAPQRTPAPATNAQSTAKTTQTEKAAATAPAAAPQPAAKSDASGVNISPRAKEMALAKKVVENTPDIREDKVAKFKEMIANGQYKPDAAKITEGIVREAVRDEIAKNPDQILSN